MAVRGWLLALPLLLAACDMDLTDPNNPNESQAIATAAGIKQVAVGLQAEYGNALVNPIYITGLVADEIGAIAQAFESYRNVDAGLPAENNVGTSSETWATMYDVVQDANVLLDNVPNIPNLQPGTTSGIIALAKLFKAMAFGNLLQAFERIPLVVGVEHQDAAFGTREEGLTAVLALLNEARQQLATTPASAEFTSQVLAPGFDLANTIDAMIARYALIAGDLTQALAAAQRVNLNVLSEFRFSANDVNPLWNMWNNSGNAYRMRPEDSFRLQAQPGDMRVGYWVTEAAPPSGQTGSIVPLDEFTKWTLTVGREASFPAYFPDELRLIQAEVLARQNNLGQALVLLNQVRTQCTSTLAEPVACLPALTTADVPTQAALLDAILRERQYELYLQGVAWSDLRRFGKTVKYQYMPVPEGECTRNSSTPQELCRTAGI